MTSFFVQENNEKRSHKTQESTTWATITVTSSSFPPAEPNIKLRNCSFCNNGTINFYTCKLHSQCLLPERNIKPLCTWESEGKPENPSFGLIKKPTLALASNAYGDSKPGSLEWLLATSASNLAVIVVPKNKCHF